MTTCQAKRFQSSVRWKLWLVIALAATMVVLVACHVHGVNGPWYWNWTWRRLSWWRVYPVMLLAVAPFFVGQYLYARRRRVGIALLLVSISTVALQFAAISAEPLGLGRVVFSVQNTVITSYYTAATMVKRMPPTDWLPVYSRFIEQLMIHARYKPPGPILFFWTLIHIFGEGSVASFTGASLMAVGAALGVPATYGLVKHFSGDSDGGGDSAFHAASFFAICPSLVLFFPQFDQVYPAMACALLVLWGLALSTGRLRFAVGAGALLAALLMFSYIFLIFGLFMGVLSLLHIARRRWAGVGLVVGQSLIFLGVIVVIYLLGWELLGFNPIATAQTIARGQDADMIPLMRPFPKHIVFDLLDIALGTGWISFLLVAFEVGELRSGLFKLFDQSPAARLTFLALLEIATVLAAALLPGEDARLYLPLMPLLMAPIGFELRKWSPGRRMVVYACLFIITCVICQNMIFLYAGPEIEGITR